MSKIFTGSALSSAFISILITFVSLGACFYLVTSNDAKIKAQKIVPNESINLTKTEINNLIIAAFVGEVANVNSDEKAIAIKRKTEVVLASYQLNSPDNYYNSHALYSD